MLALFAALLLSADAAACSPGFAALLAHSPADGQADVPRDAVIQVQLGDGYLDGPPRIRVYTDEGEVQGTVQGWSRAEDLVAETGLYTFTPGALLPVRATVRVEVEGLAPELARFQFSTGPSTVHRGEGSERPGAPTLEALWVEEYSADRGVQTSCDVDRWRQMGFTVRPGEADPDALSWIVLHRVDPEHPAGAVMDGAEPFAVLGPVGLADAYALDAADSFDLDRALTEECFVAVVVDGAGHPSAASRTLCGEEVERMRCGTGAFFGLCATGAGPAGLLAGLLAALGAVRRRAAG